MIALIGYGFVGKAYYNAFKSHQDIIIIDPAFNKNKIEDIKHLQSAIICVPTPSEIDGTCNMNIVYDVLKTLPNHIPILIKSTISLDGWKYIEQNFHSYSITFSPEFLRAASADEDLKNLKHVFLAGGNTDYWRDFYSYPYPEIKVTVCRPQDAIAIKYFRNAYLATKVSYFNQVYDFCKSLDLDFDCVRYGIASDNRIGESHTFVEENNRGWGGMCFPKDTSALEKQARDNNIDLSLLSASINYNKKIRNKFD
jgi:UDPglucose 6-dehydrogenase